jgi:PAS domain S-box-containing protein
MKRDGFKGLMLTCFLLVALAWAADTALGSYAPGRQLIVVGSKEYAPFEFAGPDGDPRGIFVDYWQAWSRETGVPIDYRLAAWPEALRILESGEADIISGMFQTEERERRFDFGQSFLTIDAGIFFHESVLGVRTLDDLKGFGVGVVQDDFAQEYLPRHAPQLQLKVYPDYDALVRAALNGDVRVFIGDEPVILFLLARHADGKSFRLAPTPLYSGEIRPAVRKGDSETLALLNSNAQAVPEDRMSRIVDGWTGQGFMERLPWTWVAAVGGLLLALALMLVFSNRKLLRRVGWTSDSLARSEERYQLATRGSNDGIWDWDRDTDEVYFSPRWKSIIGYEDHEIPNRIEEWKSRIHPDDFDRVMEANQSLFDNSADLFEVEYRLRHKDGSWRWIYGRGTCLRDEKGHIRRMAGAHSDLTKRREMEDHLRRNEETLREILDNMMDGFYRVDMEGRLIMVNPRMYEMLGYTRDDDLLGKDVATEFYYSPEQRKPFLEKIMVDGIVSGYTAALRHRDGSPVEVETNSHLIVDQRTGKPVGIEGVVRDVGERRRHELELQRLIAKLEAKNDELERFTYTVSHDLKSPIITIKGFLGLLERDIGRGDRERVLGDLARINSATDKMELLLRELLELSRVGRMDNPLVQVSLEEVAREALELSQGLFEESGGRVQGLESLPSILCDRPRMVQVFLNLFSNAVKFRSPERPLLVRIDVSTHRGNVVVRIEDNGNGIKAEYLETVFGLFQQLDQKQEGSGLGLALVRRIIENHGGRIWAESEGEGKGAAFVFSLPRSGFRTGQ